MNSIKLRLPSLILVGVVSLTVALLPTTTSGSAGTGSRGYWLVASDGGIFAFGQAQFYGSTGSIHLNAPIVGMASTPTGNGYWMVASDGGIFSYGDAQFFGSTGSLHLVEPIVGMAATPDGGGDRMVAADGGIFSFGDAQYYGSAGGTLLPSPVVGMSATSDGKGYWISESNGRALGFGDAQGSADALPAPVVAIASEQGTNGYLQVTANGYMYAGAPEVFDGDPGNSNVALNKPIVGITTTSDGKGYWLVASDGGIFNYGDATFYGSTGSLVRKTPRRNGCVGLSSRVILCAQCGRQARRPLSNRRHLVLPPNTGCEALLSGICECDSNRDGHWSTDRHGERCDVARLVHDLLDLCQELFNHSLSSSGTLSVRCRIPGTDSFSKSALKDATAVKRSMTAVELVGSICWRSAMCVSNSGIGRLSSFSIGWDRPIACPRRVTTAI